ncbi:MAG: glycosyltransferase family 4 protein [Candidatus Syntropharchaeales archaeon]
MNLLFLPKLLPRADIIGGPILIYHRIKNLAAMGHRITIIAPSYGDLDRKDRSLEPFCDRIILVDSLRNRSEKEVEELQKRLKRPKFFLMGDGGFLQGIEDALKELVTTVHFDAIIAEYSMMGQYIEANQDIIPPETLKVISVHECYTKAFELRKARGEKIDDETIKELSAYEFRMYSSADRILSLTREDGAFLAEYAPDLKDKIRIVPHGVDTDFYTPPAYKRVDRGTKNILYLGNFEHYPNVDAVLNFMENYWEKIVKAVPDAKFYAVGHNPPPEILKFRSENVIVKQGGDNENVRQTYWDSDVFVAPITLGTGFRGKILEAMACGLPVVGTSLATFGIEYIQGKGLFSSDDPDLMTNCIIKLLKDPKLREKMGADALELSKRYDHRCAASILEKVLKGDR